MSPQGLLAVRDVPVYYEYFKVRRLSAPRMHRHFSFDPFFKDKVFYFNRYAYGFNKT